MFIDVGEGIQIPIETNHAAIRLSGGADSALLLYLICVAYKAANKPVTIHPFTVIHEIRNWQHYYSQQVIDFVRGEFNTNIECPLLSTALQPKVTSSYIDEQERLKHSLVDLHYGDITCFNGVTINPPETKEVINFWGPVWSNREKHRDYTNVDEKRKSLYCIDEGYNEAHPFYCVDKRVVAKLYNQYDLTNTLLPLTRSCEGFAKVTDNYTKTCGECWWCKEREWAWKNV